MYVVFGLIDPRNKRVFHVGCTREPQPEMNKLEGLPGPVAARINELKAFGPQLVILQVVDTRPKAEWVKWSVRFRRDLVTEDWKEYGYLARFFTNSKRTRRFLGEEIPSDADNTREFLDFDERHPEVFEELLRLARAYLAEGNGVPGVDTLIGTIRSEGKQSIQNAYKPFYARKLLMEEPRLLGKITIVPGVAADDLVLADGRTWQEFASEHLEELGLSNSYSEDEGEDWTY